MSHKPVIAWAVGWSCVVITMQRNSGAGGECCIANAGNDLLKHGEGFVLNLSTMTLHLR